MHIGCKNEWREYKMNEHMREQVTEEDVNAIVDNDLKFHNHTAETVKSGNAILGLIKKSFVSLDKTAYLSCTNH